ncbi:MAG: hypothetical protein DLM61_06510 [Pseudonocardiales bacterium]|nr:MAG: hypothetical protein DLM61_06510 [Pseudonocardiales bacterium]
MRQTSEHCGEDTTGPRSRTVSHTREPVITGHLIYGLPRWHAYVLGLGTRPAVVRFQPGHHRAAAQLRRLDRDLAAQRDQAPKPTASPKLVSVPSGAGRQEAA